MAGEFPEVRHGIGEGKKLKNTWKISLLQAARNLQSRFMLQLSGDPYLQTG